MTDELERLRAKNRELLDEKKAAKAKADELAERVKALERERDEARQELHRVTVEAPRMQLIEQIAADGMARPLLRELEERFTVGDGEVLLSQDGQAITTDDDQPVKLDRDGLLYLVNQGMIPEAMIKQSRGSGAKGSRVPSAPREPGKRPEPVRRFGIR
ncbi:MULTISPECIES: hypothetical protein [Halorhodospira]|uniref:hypothetical protein n=1 Tax=Halorhodospira TaxID=85108 RepID=UPI001EE7B9F2|nr:MULTISPECIES: hypothetical protein [Halorhodospira]MCG5528596.1 hypothetical protein [Halorhodospira halophila]MCG5543741.1 hypothetical protein [Halorhodospira sp. 9628]